jgi:hypothetical protein
MSSLIVRDNIFYEAERFAIARYRPYDFHLLRASSPAIGSGAATPVSEDFDELTRSSTHPDIGAFVFHAAQ